MNTTADGDCPGGLLPSNFLPCEQGSLDTGCTLRCAILQANDNASPDDRIVFDIDINDSGQACPDAFYDGSQRFGGPCVLSIETALPIIADGLYIDGNSQRDNQGDHNNSTVFMDVTFEVGTRDHLLSPLELPAIQIQPLEQPAEFVGFQVNATTAVVLDGLSIYGFSGVGEISTGYGNVILESGTNATIIRSFIGVPSDMQGEAENDINVNATLGFGVVSNGSVELVVVNSLVVANLAGGIYAIDVGNLTIDDAIVALNGVYEDDFYLGAGINATGTIVGASITNCLIAGNAGRGIDTLGWIGEATISDNFIVGNGISNLTHSQSPPFPYVGDGILLDGLGSVVEYNLIGLNWLAGVAVVGPVDSMTPTDNRISKNSIWLNCLINYAVQDNVCMDVDLLHFDVSGYGRTDNAENDGLTNWPDLTEVSIHGDTLRVFGTSDPNAELELFSTHVNIVLQGGYDISPAYLGTVLEGGLDDLDADPGSFHFELSLPDIDPLENLVRGDPFIMTATLLNSTSEYGGITIVRPGDLSVVVTGPEFVGVDQSYPITVTAALAGDNDAYPVNITIELAGDSTVTPDSIPMDWSCNGTNPILCSTDHMDVNATASLVFAAVAPPLLGTSTFNASEITSTSIDDTDLSNNADLLTTVISDAVDLVTQFSVENSLIGSMLEQSYYVTLKNLGPVAALNPQVAITLPAGSDFGSAGGSHWSCGAPVILGSGEIRVICTLQQSLLGQAPLLTLHALAPVDSGDYAATAEATAAMRTELHPTNNSATATFTVRATDLVVGVVDAPDPVASGSQLLYHVNVANHGLIDADLARLTVTLPSGATLLSATAPLWTCTQMGQVVQCQTATLAAQSDAVIMISVLPPPMAGVMHATFLVSSNAREDEPSDNEVTVATTVVVSSTSSDLGVTLVATPDPVEQGGQETFVVTVSNAGPDAAVNPVVTLMLPTASSFMTASGEGWTCSHDGGVVSCHAATLASGADEVLMFTAVAAATPGTRTATATVASESADPDVTNNSSTFSGRVAAFADVEVALTAVPQPVRAGETLTFTLTVTDLGPHDASAVNATLSLGGEAEFGVVTQSGWTCSSTGSTMTCSRDALNGTSVIAWTVVAPPEAGTLVATASVMTGTFDPNGGNNEVVFNATVLAADACLADSECGTATSGRICSANVCSDGCRGASGNGCPANEMCTSTTATAGVCTAITTADAGTRDGGAIDAPSSSSDGGARDAGTVGTVDARIGVDAATARPDAAATSDAGTTGSSSGGCSYGGRGASGSAYGLLVLAGLCLVRRRRR